MTPLCGLRLWPERASFLFVETVYQPAVMLDLSLGELDDGFGPIFWGRSVSESIRTQSRLTYRGNLDAQSLRQFFMPNTHEQPIGSFLEVHVCTSIDKV